MNVSRPRLNFRSTDSEIITYVHVVDIVPGGLEEIIVGLYNGSVFAFNSTMSTDEPLPPTSISLNDVEIVQDPIERALHKKRKGGWHKF